MVNLYHSCSVPGPPWFPVSGFYQGAAFTKLYHKNPVWFSHVARVPTDHRWVAAPLTNPHGRRWRLDARDYQAPISQTPNNNQVRPTPAAQHAP
eukprot:scaffold781_cov123-Isochrysis_galbana.AAC.10